MDTKAMQNRYDDPEFFDKYAQMARSQQGLSGAGEWATLRGVLPPLKNRRVLDLGCGYGWHCLYAAEQGADKVVGTDISEKMLAVAQEKCAESPVGGKIELLRAPMEALDFEDGSFDVVLSSLALHYVADYPALVRKIARWLAPGGAFVCTVEHPIFTAEGREDWVYGENGEISHYPVDRYFMEGARETVFLGETVRKYHRTLTTYVETLLANGLRLRHLEEPMPPADMLDLPGMRDELRRPMMLILAAEKERAGEAEACAQ